MPLDEIIKRKPYEKIVHIVRRHWITYIPTVILYSFLAIIPFPLLFVLGQANPAFFQDANARAIIVLLVSAFELSIALFFYASFLMYYLDMIIVTNDRLVEVSQRSLFSRKVSELDLYKIQDATSDVSGVVATIFDYGTLALQTAGEHDNFVFDGVGHPHDLRRQLLDLAEEDRKYHARIGAHGAADLK